MLGSRLATRDFEGQCRGESRVDMRVRLRSQLEVDPRLKKESRPSPTSHVGLKKSILSL